MNRTVRTLATLVVAHAALGALAFGLAPAKAGAQDPFAKKAGENDRNVGPLGIGSGVEGQAVAIHSLDQGGPAEKAGLRVGESIVGVEGARFEPRIDPVLSIVAACERAESGSKKGRGAAAAGESATVTLLVTRDGKDAAVKVSFPSLGKHSATCPRKCGKCRKIIDAGAAFLAGKQSPDGSFPTELGGKTGKVVVTSLSALALMAAGGNDAAVQKAADWVAAKIGQPDENGFGKLGGGGGGNWNQVNWELSYGEIFLAELARKKRPDLKAKVGEVAQLLLTNQERSGGWAHGPGGPNALGYVELEIMSNWALMGLGLAQKDGVKLDQAKLAKAFDWIEQTSNGDGGVGYSPNQGQKGFGEAGRTSGAIVGYSLLGARGRPFFDKMSNFYRNHQKSLETGHVSPCMHLLSGAIASYTLSPKDWQEYVDQYRLPIMVARRLDGSFAPTPTQESQSLHSNTDFTVGSCWTTATYVLILALPDEKLPGLLGRDKADKPGKTKTGGVGEDKPGRTATGGGKSDPKASDEGKPASDAKASDEPKTSDKPTTSGNGSGEPPAPPQDPAAKPQDPAAGGDEPDKPMAPEPSAPEGDERGR